MAARHHLLHATEQFLVLDLLVREAHQAFERVLVAEHVRAALVEHLGADEALHQAEQVGVGAALDLARAGAHRRASRKSRRSTQRQPVRQELAREVEIAPANQVAVDLPLHFLRHLDGARIARRRGAAAGVIFGNGGVHSARSSGMRGSKVTRIAGTCVESRQTGSSEPEIMANQGNGHTPALRRPVPATARRSTACTRPSTPSCAASRRPTCGGKAGPHPAAHRARQRGLPAPRARRRGLGEPPALLRRRRRSDAPHPRRPRAARGCRRSAAPRLERVTLIGAWTSPRRTARRRRAGRSTRRSRSSRRAPAARGARDAALLRRPEHRGRRARPGRSRPRRPSATGRSRAPGCTSGSGAQARERLMDAERRSSTPASRLRTERREELLGACEDVSMRAARARAASRCTTSDFPPRLARRTWASSRAWPRRTRSVPTASSSASAKARWARCTSPSSRSRSRAASRLKILKFGLGTREVIARFELERQALALHDASEHRAHPRRRAQPRMAARTSRWSTWPASPITRYCDERRLGLDSAHRAVRAGVRRRAARAPARHHPPRPEAVEHPRHRDRRAARCRRSSTSASPRRRPATRQRTPTAHAHRSRCSARPNT